MGKCILGIKSCSVVSVMELGECFVVGLFYIFRVVGLRILGIDVGYVREI